MGYRTKFVTRIASGLAVTALVACGDLLGTGAPPSKAITLTGSNGADTGNGTGPDTGTTNPDTVTVPDTSTGPDTTAVPGDTIPEAVIRGTMIGIDSTKTPFVELGSIPGVRITAFRWLGVDSSAGGGQPLRDSVAFTVSAGDGTFHFTGLRSGVYILRAVPPNGSGYQPAEIATTVGSISSVVRPYPLRFYLHKLP